jgi:hypothetical protein
LRRRFADRPEAVRLPGGPLIPVAALVLSLIFLASTTTANLIAGAIALAIGIAIYFLRGEPPSSSAVPPAP